MSNQYLLSYPEARMGWYFHKVSKKGANKGRRYLTTWIDTNGNTAGYQWCHTLIGALWFSWFGKRTVIE